MEWSTQQLNIFTAIEENQHVIVNADAGTGKSTLIFGCLERFKVPSLVLSFNKSIREDNERRLKKMKLEHEIMVSTMHSYGMTFFPHKKQVLPYKVEKYVGEEWQLDRSDKWSLVWLLKELRGRGYLRMTLDELKMELKKPSILKSPAENWVRDAQDVWDCLNDLDAITDEIDFDDMCRLPVLYEWVSNGDIPFDIVYLDEVQDFAPIQVEMVRQMLIAKPTLRVVIVGDRKQSIYGFRGAANSFEELGELLEGAPSLPLTTTYRCRQKIADFVNNKVAESEMVAAKTGGEVVRIFNEEMEDRYAVDEWLEHGPNMIIATRNSTLISIWISLWERGVDASFKGTSAVALMRGVVKSFQQQDIRSIRHELAKQAAVNYKGSKNMSDHTDVAQALVELIDRLRISHKFELLEKLDQMAAIKSDSLRLETVWSAKGREAGVVVFIWNFWTKDQKENVKYVALTRAIDKLITVVPPDEE